MMISRLLIYSLITLIAPSLSQSQANEVTLKEGNSFNLRISGVPADEVALVSQKFTISDGGEIRLPYLKIGIKAAGLKPSVLARKIETAYRAAQIYTSPVVANGVLYFSAMTYLYAIAPESE